MSQKKKTTAKKGKPRATTTRKVPAEKPNAKNILEEIMPLLLTAGGVIGASVVGKLIDKVAKADDGTDKINIRKLAKPIVLTAGGVALKIFVKDQNLKALADGIAAGGILSGVKIVLPKNLLSHLDGLGEADLRSIAANSRRVPIELSINHQAYQPDLPMLEAAPDEMAGDEEPVLAAVPMLSAANDADIIDLSGDEVEIL